MKTPTLIGLYALVAILAGGVTVAKKFQNTSTTPDAHFALGDTPLSGLPEDKIAQIIITEDDLSVTIDFIDGKPVVAQRANYPADFGKIQSLLSTLDDVSVTQAIEAGPSYDDRFGLITTVQIKDKTGSTLRELTVGKDIINGKPDQVSAMMGQSNAVGSYLRLPSDQGIVYAVKPAVTGVSPKPKNWLSNDFLQIKKATSITLSQPGKLDSIAWKATRPNGKEDFTLTGEIPTGMTPDSSALRNLNNQFGYAKFEDVLSPAAAKGLSDHNKTRRATIQTQEGFTYTIDISPKTVAGTSNKILSFTVTENFPTARTRPAAETSEEAASSEQYFATQLADKRDRFQKIKALEGNYYEVSNFVVENILKSRDDLLMQADQPAPTAPTNFTTPPLRMPGQ